MFGVLLGDFTALGDGKLGMAFGLLVMTAIFGLPIAAITAWILIPPILRRLMNNEITYLRAILVGLSVSLIVVLFSIGWGRWFGYQQSLNDNFNSSIGRGEFVSERDGILTAYGWQLLLERSLAFIIYCSACGLITRRIIGTPIAFNERGSHS